ncbi:MAG: hypothetical protein GVY19_11920 [Bacteroidetes bacterium]|jgi:hypothetical protein|nr:hypothetical protein [Bacteroidota bacterium]
MKKLFTVFLIALLPAIYSIAQTSLDFEDVIGAYQGDNGEKFVQPLADVVTANFNSGLYHNAVAPKLGLQIYVGVKGMIGFIPDKNKTFMAQPPGYFEPQDLVEAPTLMGSSDAVVVDGENSTQAAFPGGLEVNWIPLAVPQLTLGSVYGTNLTLRYFQLGLSEDIGDIQIFGWGLKHNISQWIPGFIPLDLAAGFYLNEFQFTDYVEGSAGMVNLQASYTKLLITVYGGLGYEFSDLSIAYTFEDEESNTELPISYDLQGNNTMRLTAGVALNLGPVKLNVDYNLAYQSTLSFGLGLAFNDK